MYQEFFAADKPQVVLLAPDAGAYALLHSEVEDAVGAGLAPDSAAAQDLAWRWMRLPGQSADAEPGGTVGAWLAAAIVCARAQLFFNYLAPDEVAALRARMLAHAGEWTALAARVRGAMRAGAGVKDPAVQVLAGAWRQLYQDVYFGADLELEAKIATAFQREPGLRLGVDGAVVDFIQRAIMHLYHARRGGALNLDASPKPSALMVAILRAAHQLLDAPRVFDDPLALRILGADEEAALRANPGQYADPVSRALRTTLVVRGRLAEDEWAAAQDAGCRQYVVLGAGLDTYACRALARPDTRVFEVDLPSTQQWKRERLRAAGIAEPANLRYVAVDFERATLDEALRGAGFQPGQPAFFSWLGVTLYLTPEDVVATLRFIAGCARGSAVVFDYGVAPELLAPMERLALELVSAKAASRGEPWKCYFDPRALDEILRGLGFGTVANFDRAQLSARYLAGRADGLRMGGVTRLVHATV